MIDISWFPDAKKEYNSLDGSQKIHIDKGIKKIKNQGMLAGKKLTGNLNDCREIKHKKLGLRIIFKENSQKIEIIEIIAVGKRREKEVYRDAKNRLENYE